MKRTESVRAVPAVSVFGLMVMAMLNCSVRQLPGTMPVPFEENGQWGYRSESGTVVIATRYIIAHDFSEHGIAAVADRTGWYYIDTSGKMVIRGRYDLAFPFSGSCALVLWDGYRSVGLIDTQGDYIYQFEPDN